ncbi:MAG: hypothetical protein GKR91_08340 [Pseudomonadales bacterium]|nr:hypothetical protein [Pseudomonadales bacterium]
MKKIILAMSMLSLSPLSFAQDANETEIEEIIVIGELSRRAVREQIIRVENDIYSFYNERNGNPDLDIVCDDIALTGTRIPQRVCEPVFWTKARNRQVQDLIHEWSGIAELENLSQEVVLETEEMNRVYAELVATYPGFQEALLILEDLKARLEELGN